MFVRELKRGEWGAYFECFSRQHLGRPVTVEVLRPTEARPTALARRQPLIGIVFEPGGVDLGRIEVVVGSGGSGARSRLEHVIRAPAAVRIGQVKNGADEVLVIVSATDPATFVDFRADPCGVAASVADLLPDGAEAPDAAPGGIWLRMTT